MGRMWYKKVARWAGGCLVCIVAVVALIDIADFRFPMQDNRRRRRETLRYLKYFRQHICSAVRMSGEQPPGEIHSLIEFLNQRHPLLAESRALYTRWLDWENKKVIDRWGNPVRLAVISAHHYRFISAGPNGKHQDGRGDDIVHDFDPWEFADSNDLPGKCINKCRAGKLTS